MKKRALPVLGRRTLVRVVAATVVIGAGVSAMAMKGGSLPVPTTIEDFFVAGTQPEMIVDDIRTSLDCLICHGIVAEDILIAPNWQGSMMAQSARDPLFYACLTIANQDATDAGDICIRCHAPKAWMEGRSGPPTDGSLFIDDDRDGVSCHVCHRMVDPVYTPGVSPAEDLDILNGLAAMGLLPTSPGTGSMIIDPYDRRRGPFNFGPEDTPPPHSPDNPELPPFLFSPFHRTSELCATCHDVSNPAYERQADGTYSPLPLDTAHSTGNQQDMFPIERTYSEWLYSAYPAGVDAGGRFGGNLPDGIVRTCQDCHIPDYDGNACIQGQKDPSMYPPRPNTPAHDFAGGNSWIRDAIPDLIDELWPFDAIPDATYFAQRLSEGQDRSIAMLQLAATVESTQEGSRLLVRVTNESGHKLPTGYPEGRRMWLNVQFFNDVGGLVAERGEYNALTAELHTSDTTVYEAHLGLDAAAAGLTGLPEGVGFHFALNNKVYKDNRIPPRGFTNATYAAFGGAPVGANYADGQYWSDAAYALPEGAVSATVNLYYQTSSREYIEFLRDANVTNDWGNRLHALWEAHGKSAPVLMVGVEVGLGAFVPGDFDGDGDADLFDFAGYAACVTGPNGGPYPMGCEVFDFDADQDVDAGDFGRFQEAFTGS